MYSIEELNKYNEYPLTKQRKEIEFLTNRITYLEEEIAMTNEKITEFLNEINVKLDRLLPNTYEVSLETICPSCGKSSLEMNMSKVSNTTPPKRLYTCGVCSYLTYKPITYGK